MATTMTTTYLPDASDFTDIPVMLDPCVTYPERTGYVPCPTCECHGKWNLRRDAYGPGKHFQAMCGQCWGWGWVTGADVTCVHTWVATAPDQPWRCWHTLKCAVCGVTRSYSSDD
jgi:hypothetical protein